MTDEFGNKQREFEKLRKSFEDLMVELTQTQSTVKARDGELVAARQTINDKTAVLDRQLEQYSQLERVVADLEDKNKRLTDLLNSQICNKAESYKENVLSKLTKQRQTMPTAILLD